MKSGLDNNTVSIVIVGPSAEVISGSLLRPANIYYSLRDLRKVVASCIPIKSTFDLLPQLRKILHADIIVLSGVNPWISAFIAILGKILGRRVVTDFHGFAWLEMSITNASRYFMRMLLLVSEKISFKFSRYVIVSSPWLKKTLMHYFGLRSNFLIIENSVFYLFEKLVREIMERFETNELRTRICYELIKESECRNKLLFIAPLPPVFSSNMLAYKELLRLNIFQYPDVMIVITGVKAPNLSDNIIHVGYVNYVNYVMLLLASDAILLPYPNNAICGGVRNKILEAGYCKKAVISTKVGMMHLNAVPNIHYMSIEIEGANSKTELNREKLENIAKSLNELTMNSYSFEIFKRRLLEFVSVVLKGL
jgi:glycosyltransferase involved in cell wall biosynthesis